MPTVLKSVITADTFLLTENRDLKVVLNNRKPLRLRSFGVIPIWISDPRFVWIMVHQRNRESALVMDSPVPLMHHDPDRSWITDPDPDHSKGTQPNYNVLKPQYREIK